MGMEQLERRLEYWKRGMFAALGAAVTLLGTAVIVHPNKPHLFGWIIAVSILWLAIAPPGFILLMSKPWREVLLSRRLNTAFGYLGCAWLILLSTAFTNPPSVSYSIIIITALALSATYWYLRKRGRGGPEDIFP